MSIHFGPDEAGRPGTGSGGPESAAIETGQVGRTTCVTPAIAARAVTRRFPGVIANDRVTFEVLPGEVHALLGENGSGKTTLCKMLTGLYRPDEGEIEIEGRPTRLTSPRDAYQAGIFMVQQHFSLVERLTVAENVVLGWSRHRAALFNAKSVEREVAAAADEFHLAVDPSAPVWRLSVGERQRVEILKSLYRGARILILDEPTTVLTPQECDELFVTLRRLAADGGSVIFISHKLREVLAVCDRVTVLRQGRSVGTTHIREEGVDVRHLARLMVGREISLARKASGAVPADAPIALRLEDLTVTDDDGRRPVQGVSLDVRAGEVVGIAGVAGNGQRELAEAITGLRARSGSVTVGPRRLRGGDARQAIEAGVAYVPEDRMGTGLAPGLKVTDNILLRTYRNPALTRGPLIRSRQVAARTRELLDDFNVKGSPDSVVRQLSGGNAQKVLLAREMSSDPRVLVVAALTRGLDVSAMQSVRELLLAAASRGLAVLLISEDLDEVLDLADRVAVMYDGRIMGVVEHERVDRNDIGLMMAGLEAAS